MALSAAILIFGLPHGALDLAMIRQDGVVFARTTLITVMLYLGCASLMLAAWLFMPLAALIFFFALSATHFAEDWTTDLPPFFAHGSALALLTIPALFQSKTLAAMFAALTGAGNAAVLVGLSTMIAPVAIVAAVIGVTILWQQGKRQRALELGGALAAMLLLPPLPAFALYFCLLHSPRQFALATRHLAVAGVSGWRCEAAVLSLAALGIAAAIFCYDQHIAATQSMIVACFVTLSILTLPHIVVPRIVHRLRPLA